MPLVSVCVATFRRPDGLAALLDSIVCQELSPEIDVEVVVVDNDPPTARPVVDGQASTSPFPIHYLTQSEPNISLTRNTAVAHAKGDLLWFVDDDEVADPKCLALLVSALEDFNADGVFGPVHSVFDGPQPPWIEAIYSRPVHETGSISKAHRTGNTLVRADALRLVPGPFDPEYGRSGGSDSMLFRTLEARGLKFINSAEASVSEAVPPSHATWRWVRTRVRRQGRNYGRQSVALHGGRFTPSVLWMMAKAVVQVLMSSLSALATWPSRKRRATYLQRMWTNVGKFEGVLGAVSFRDD